MRAVLWALLPYIAGLFIVVWLLHRDRQDSDRAIERQQVAHVHELSKVDVHSCHYRNALTRRQQVLLRNVAWMMRVASKHSTSPVIRTQFHRRLPQVRGALASVAYDNCGALAR